MTGPMIERWERDQSRPQPRDAARDLAARVLGPAVALFAVIVGIGLLITKVLGGFTAEESVNRSLQAGRTPFWDGVTMVWSRIGNTEIVIGVCIIAVALIWWRTKQWWWAVIPGIAIAVQATVFVLATAVAGRARPEVDKLDPAPPTSSYPSGHVGASTALYFTFALMAQRIENPVLRRVVTAVCLLVPFLVAYARVYRGMHHVTDVAVGFLNGLVCCLLAWHWLRRKDS